MTKIDLHVHSKYSKHPEEWFLKRLGAAESYTEPEKIYSVAKERGMDFITITDHNQIEGSLLLKEKYPKEVITGVETTTYFPEDECKIHILIYGLNAKQFSEIEKIRTNIYDLRDYIVEQNLAYSVAHPTYSINGKINIPHIEKLLVLFDVFEGINGSLLKSENQIWHTLIKNLTPSQIERLYNKYKIEPLSHEPWIKGITGGSDDHAGLFLAKTYTEIDCRTPEELIQQLKNKKSSAQGMSTDYKDFTFSIYKIGYDFSKSKSNKSTNSLFSRLTELIFEKKALSPFDHIKIQLLKSNNLIKGDKIISRLIELIENIKNTPSHLMEEKLEILYDKISEIADEFLMLFVNSLDHNIREGDLLSLIKNISASIPGVFLALPFFTAISHMNQNRQLLFNLEKQFPMIRSKRGKRILWFSDTFTDLNGVSMTLQKLGWLSYYKELDIKIATSLSEDQNKNDLPPTVMNLPFIYQFNLPHYEQYVIKIPSLLKSIKEIHKFDPDEIYISTPGPIGLLAILVAKLFNIKSYAIYHSDLTMETETIVGEQTLTTLMNSYNRWFYSLADHIKVPSYEYINILESRGYNRTHMSLFKRGIDSHKFSPKETGKQYLKQHYHIEDGINLLYVGRISKDKNLDFITKVYDKIIHKYKKINFIITGTGPYLEEYKKKMKLYNRVYFLSKVDQNILPEIYSGADLLLFPSNTDTFGMVVLEAQSSGLPALVSDKGGPQEIIIPEKTGWVAKADDFNDWLNKLENIIQLFLHNNKFYKKISYEARQHILRTADWEIILNDLIGKNESNNQVEDAA